MPALAELLGAEPEPEVRRFAAAALLRLGAESAAAQPALLVVLGDADNAVRGDAVRTLSALKPKSEQITPPLLAMLEQEKETPVLLEVIQALQALRLSAAHPVATALINLLLTHSDELVRAKSLDALKQLGLSFCPIDVMVKCLANEKDKAIRDGVGQILKEQLDQIGATRMTELKPLLRHKDTAIVILALTTVRRCKGEAEAVTEDVLALIKHTDTSVRNQAFEGLQAIGPAAKTAIPVLMERLKADRTDNSALIATTLAAVAANDPKVVQEILPHLVNALRPLRSSPDKGSALHLKINKALVLIGQPAVDKIFELFTTIDYKGVDNIDSRTEPIRGLGQLGPSCRSKSNFEQVRRLVNREYREPNFVSVRLAAGKAVKAMYAD